LAITLLPAALEPGDERKPAGSGVLAVDFIVAHLLVVVGNDLDERAHDVGKEADSDEHDHDADEHLVLSDRREVPVAARGQRHHCEVAAGYQSVVVARARIEVESDEPVRLVLRLHIHHRAHQVPDVASEVDDDKADDYEAEDLVRVHEDVLRSNPVVARAVLEKGPEHPIESREIKDLDQLGEPEQTEKLDPQDVAPRHIVDGEGSREVDEEPTAVDVAPSDLLVLPHGHERLLVLILQHEVFHYCEMATY